MKITSCTHKRNGSQCKCFLFIPLPSSPVERIDKEPNKLDIRSSVNSDIDLLKD